MIMAIDKFVICWNIINILVGCHHFIFKSSLVHIIFIMCESVVFPSLEYVVLFHNIPVTQFSEIYYIIMLTICLFYHKESISIKS